jgi:peptidyl-tRNA hydrolase
MDPAAYVLQDFDKSEQILMIETIDRVVKAIDTWLRYGVNLMMTRHNGTAEQAARNVATPPPPDASN